MVRRYDVDLDARLMKVLTQDGTWIEGSVPETLFGRSPTFRRLGVDFENSRLHLLLPTGAEALVELDPDRDAAAALAGRRIVYLDQNKWSEVAASLHGGGSVDRALTTSSRRLADLVEEERIVLPMSAAHMVETSPLFGERRETLAATVLELSRGWQMRNPLVVRREELRAAVADEPPLANGVFSLDPDVIFSRGKSGRPASRDLPELFRRVYPRIVDASSIYEVLVEDDPVDHQDGYAAAESWARAEGELSQKIKGDSLPRERVRTIVGAHVLADLAEDLAAIKAEHLYPGKVGAWLEERGLDDLLRMPYLARVAAVTFARFQRQHRWERNDLFDVHFLCCAAGYSDVVVAERRTAGDLRTAKSIPPGAHIASTLTDAVDLLDSTIL